MYDGKSYSVAEATYRSNFEPIYNFRAVFMTAKLERYSKNELMSGVYTALHMFVHRKG